MHQKSENQVSDLQWHGSQQLPLQKQPGGTTWTGPAAGAVPQQQPDLALATMRLHHTHLAETAGHCQQRGEMRAFECSLRAEEAGMDSVSVTVFGWSPMGFVPAQSVAGKADLKVLKGAVPLLTAAAGKADLGALKGLAGKGELALRGAGSRPCLE